MWIHALEEKSQPSNNKPNRPWLWGLHPWLETAPECGTSLHRNACSLMWNPMGKPKGHEFKPLLISLLTCYILIHWVNTFDNRASIVKWGPKLIASSDSCDPGWLKRLYSPSPWRIHPFLFQFRYNFDHIMFCTLAQISRFPVHGTFSSDSSSVSRFPLPHLWSFHHSFIFPKSIWSGLSPNMCMEPWGSPRTLTQSCGWHS